MQLMGKLLEQNGASFSLLYEADKFNIFVVLRSSFRSQRKFIYQSRPIVKDFTKLLHLGLEKLNDQMLEQVLFNIIWYSLVILPQKRGSRANHNGSLAQLP